MSENFTVFVKPDGVLVVAKGELKGVALSPTLRGMEGESPVDTTMAFCEYLETMLGKVDEYGDPLFKLNPACKVAMPAHKMPVEGELWTFGVDDKFIITTITRRTNQDKTKMVYEFFSAHKKGEYAVCSILEDQIGADHPMVRKMEAGKFAPMNGEWLLTVKVGALKTGQDGPKDPKWVNSFFLEFVDIKRK